MEKLTKHEQPFKRRRKRVKAFRMRHCLCHRPPWSLEFYAVNKKEIQIKLEQE